MYLTYFNHFKALFRVKNDNEIWPEIKPKKHPRIFQVFIKIKLLIAPEKNFF